MSTTYLARLRLGGFRAYTDTVEITMAEGPGLTVFVGPNGLGKSTLFDAVEWGVTGELKRIHGIDAKDSEKIQSLGRAPDVKLWFSDDTCIHRTLADVNINGLRGEEAIANWLASPQWRMTHIADCLHLTHFLGQSTRQLFVHQDGQERWSRLEGPAGLQTLWTLEQTLGRRQTTNAFKNLKDELNHQYEQALSEKQNFIKLLADLRRLDGLARAEDSISPNEILSRCNVIRQSLNTNFKISSEAAQPAEIDELLKQQKILLEHAERALSEERARLDEWSVLAQTFSQRGIQLVEAKQNLITVKEAANTALSIFNQSVASVQKLTSAHDAASSLVANRQGVVKQIQTAINHRQQITEIKKLLSRQTDHATSIEQQLTALSEGIKTQQGILQAITSLQQRYEAANKRKRFFETLLVECKDFHSAIESLQQTEVIVAEANQAESQVLVNKIEAQEWHRKAETELTRLNAQFLEAKAAAETIAAAVAQIASALHDGESDCPVCSTSFTEHGKLKLIAEQSAAKQNKRLFEIENDRSVAMQARDAAQQNLANIDAQLSSIIEKRALLKSAVENVRLREEHLRANPLLASVPFESFLQLVQAELVRVVAEVANITSEIASSKPYEDISSEISRMAVARGAAELERQRIISERGDHQKKLSLLEAEIVDQPGVTLHTLNNDMEQAQIALEVAQKDAEKAAQALMDVMPLKDKHQDQLAEANRAVEIAEKNIADLQASRTMLVSRWQALGYSGEPQPEMVTVSTVKLHERRMQLQVLTSSHKELVEGYRQYINRADLQRLDSQLRETLLKHSAADEISLMRKLESDEASAQMALTKFNVVHRKREELMRRLKVRNADIRNRVSAPLNESIARFCKALMTDRNLKVSVDAIANAASAEALLSFAETGNSDGKRKDPLLYMSEGQLAAVNLCLLFGASVTYPWSSWKALLLDDPLHHNDTIHSAAFIDVIRNLIMDQKYQIILSTHDMEQAGYFLRKCANAGISTRYWHLYGRNERGVLMQSG